MIKLVKVILKENFHMLANKYVKDLLWTHLLNISVLELSGIEHNVPFFLETKSTFFGDRVENCLEN